MEYIRVPELTKRNMPECLHGWNPAEHLAAPSMATHGGLCYAQAMEAAAATMDIVRDLMHDIDRTLLRQNLKLTPEQRLAKFASFMRFVAELHRAGENVRRSAKPKT
jgi:hypothetical protein